MDAAHKLKPTAMVDGNNAQGIQVHIMWLDFMTPLLPFAQRAARLCGRALLSGYALPHDGHPAGT
jgi:hypothetical protein